VATLLVRELDDETKRNLRVQAARNDRSMEAEARAILAAAVRTPARRQDQTNWFVRMHEAAVNARITDEFDNIRDDDVARAASFGMVP